jgi:hypothetical protein
MRGARPAAEAERGAQRPGLWQEVEVEREQLPQVSALHRKREPRRGRALQVHWHVQRLERERETETETREREHCFASVQTPHVQARGKQTKIKTAGEEGLLSQPQRRGLEPASGPWPCPERAAGCARAQSPPCAQQLQLQRQALGLHWPCHWRLQGL